MHGMVSVARTYQLGLVRQATWSGVSFRSLNSSTFGGSACLFLTPGQLTCHTGSVAFPGSNRPGGQRLARIIWQLIKGGNMVRHQNKLIFASLAFAVAFVPRAGYHEGVRRGLRAGCIRLGLADRECLSPAHLLRIGT